MITLPNRSLSNDWHSLRRKRDGKVANQKIKTEGGQGGRRGHSNMSHWTYTEEIKETARKQRRLESKQIVKVEISNIETKKSKV